MEYQPLLFVGFNRPLSEPMHKFVCGIAEAVQKKGKKVIFPKSRNRLFDATPADGLWTVPELANCEGALFALDQDGTPSDAMVQLGFTLAAGLPISCIVVRRSPCTSPTTELLQAYKLPLYETTGMSLSESLIEGLIFRKVT